MKMLTAICGFTALAASSAIPAQADSLADVFARMDSTARAFKGMTAGLQETVYTALAKDTSTYSGDIKLKRGKPGDVRMLANFTRPETERKSVAFDGNRGEVYYPKQKTEEVFDVSAKRDMVEQVMLLGFGGTSAELKSA
ncbi:MAG TPA: hypothetical protein VFC21_05575, partial [Bryobacteraceae bacterium]|nr:hypothetical protein [Bryobacteraceae bacterium]